MAKAKKAATSPILDGKTFVESNGESEFTYVPIKEEINPFAKKHYQEWRVQVTGDNIEKLKINRDRVMITDSMANTLNEGVREGKLNQYALYYYPAE